MPSVMAVYRKVADDALAADTRVDDAFFVADRAYKVRAVKIVPSAALTAHDTNYATITLDRIRGVTAAVIKAVTTKITGGTGNWVAQTDQTLATLANTDLAAGDKLCIKIEKAAAGVVVPACAIWVSLVPA